MQLSSFQGLSPLFLISLAVFLLVVGVMQVGILSYAYERLGIGRRDALAILFCSLAGSLFNVPIAEFPAGQAVEYRQVESWGVQHTVPVMHEWPGTQLTVNVGGALIPLAISIYLVVKNQIYASAALGIAILSALMYYLAEPVPGMGIAVPIFIPPIASALVAVLISRDYAAPLAYVSGCMGTLIGTDILNLGLMGRLGASIISIGGSGTFDGVFLTGILAVLLAGKPSLPGRTPPASPPPAEPFSA